MNLCGHQRGGMLRHSGWKVSEFDAFGGPPVFNVRNRRPSSGY